MWSKLHKSEDLPYQNKAAIATFTGKMKNVPRSVKVQVEESKCCPHPEVSQQNACPLPTNLLG